MILIGGPAHGSEREIDEDQTTITVMAPSVDNPIPSPWRYEKRTVEAETRPGVRYHRTLLVESGVPIQAVTEGLMQILLEKFASELVRQFMEGGELVGTEERAPESRTDSGILIAKR